MIGNLKAFFLDEDGAAATEYAMLAALIALVVAIGAGNMGRDICAVFNGLAVALSSLPAGAIAPIPC
ncbi:Flp family type IVb pilin [Noviherbaspirillum sp. ST9]|uniref:Flp family type IVb pilin n=1 Tax=Noviherbaspirillum sp. ST9 TaxID=3401606 RepID=UPI003B5871A3